MKLSPLSAVTCLDVDSATDFYKFTLSGIFDKMIPFKTVRVHERLFDSWFDRMLYFKISDKDSKKDLHEEKKSENDFAAWLGQKKLYQRLCRHKRRNYWNNKLNDPKIKTANIWNHIRSVYGQRKRSVERIQLVEFPSFLLKKLNKR